MSNGFVHVVLIGDESGTEVAGVFSSRKLADELAHKLEKKIRIMTVYTNVVLYEIDPVAEDE